MPGYNNKEAGKLREALIDAIQILDTCSCIEDPHNEWTVHQAIQKVNDTFSEITSRFERASTIMLSEPPTPPHLVVVDP